MVQSKDCTGSNTPYAFTHQLRTCPPPHHEDTVHPRGPSCPRQCPRPPHAHTPSESSARYHSQGRHGTHLTWSIRTAHTSHMVDSQTSSRCSIRQRAKQSFRRFRRFRRAYGAPEGRARSPPIGRRAAPRASLRAWHGPWPRARRPWLRPPRPRARSW